MLNLTTHITIAVGAITLWDVAKSSITTRLTTCGVDALMSGCEELLRGKPFGRFGGL